MNPSSRQTSILLLIAVLAGCSGGPQASQQPSVQWRTFKIDSHLEVSLPEQPNPKREKQVIESPQGDISVETLTGLLDSESDTVRLGASRAILDNVLRFREAEELSDRLRELEEAIQSAGLNRASS